MEMEIVLTKLLLFKMKQVMRNKRRSVGRVPICFRKKSKVFELSLTISSYIDSHGFFHTKIFYSGFLG